MTGPVYLKIFEDIKCKINKAELKPGDTILPEMALCKQYGASRATVRKGLAMLVNEGYIFSIPGKGNFVQEPQHNKYILYYDEMHNTINSVDKAKLLEVNLIIPDEQLTHHLKISKNKNVIIIRRLFFSDDEPIAYDVKYLPYFKGRPIVEKEIEDATFPEMMSKNMPPFALKKNLTIYSQLADKEIKNLLHITEEAALLVVEQKFYDNENKPIGIGITSFRGDYIKLKGSSQ